MLDTIIQLTMAGGMIIFCLAIMVPIINIFLGTDEAERLRRIDREVYEARAKARTKRSGNGPMSLQGVQGVQGVQAGQRPKDYHRNSDNT